MHLCRRLILEIQASLEESEDDASWEEAAILPKTKQSFYSFAIQTQGLVKFEDIWLLSIIFHLKDFLVFHCS